MEVRKEDVESTSSEEKSMNRITKRLSALKKNSKIFNSIIANRQDIAEYNKRQEEVSSNRVRHLIKDEIFKCFYAKLKHKKFSRIEVDDMISDKLIKMIENKSKNKLSKLHKRKIHLVKDLQTYLGSNKIIMAVIISSINNVHIVIVPVFVNAFDFGLCTYNVDVTRIKFCRKRPISFYFEGNPTPIKFVMKDNVGNSDAENVKNFMENEALKRFLGITRDKMIGLAIWGILIVFQIVNLLFAMGVIKMETIAGLAGG